MDDRRQIERRDNPADSRARSIDALANSQAKVGGAISDLGVAIDYLVTLAKWFIVMAIGVGLLVAAGIGILVWNGIDGARARNRLLTETADVQRVSNEVHSAVTPGQPIYEAGQAQEAALLGSLFAEVDCRTRAALKGYPPVPQGQTCSALHPDLAPQR